MDFLQVKNRAQSTLAADITSTATSLTVATGEGDKFPTSNFHITIDDEILLCTSRTGDTFTVERAKEGTTAAPHSAGAKVELRITAGIIQELQNAIKWQVVSEVNVSANVNYVDFTGLDINTDKVYILYYTIKNPTATLADCYLYVEGDYTSANYYAQYLIADGTTISVDRVNSPALASVLANERNMAQVIIMKDPDGYFRYLAYPARNTGASVVFLFVAGTKTATVANITSFRVSASVSGGIGAGSYFLLCKPRG